jgi:hypothetical protein
VGEDYYMTPVARTFVAAILVARGESAAGIGQSERGLAFARGAKDPQLLYPTMAAHAHLLAVVGRAREAHAVMDELLALAAERTYIPHHWVLYATLALDELDRIDDAASIFAGLTLETRWREASEAYATGDLGRAADILGGFGNRSDEAYVRLRAAEHGAPADLESALAFYRGVKASAYERRAAELLRGTA